MIDKIREIIEPVLQEEDAELVEIIYRKERGRQVLRLLVDKEGGIKLTECVKLNQKIGQVLDEANTIIESYILEVDSPGVDRPFRTKRDYERSRGRMVRVILSEAVMDKREYIGRLEEILDNAIKIDTDEKGIIEIPFGKIIKARQEVEF